MVWLIFIGGGLGLLIGLAVLIGQTQAQEYAWGAIARERRELRDWEHDLAAATESGTCPACRQRRRRS